MAHCKVPKKILKLIEKAKCPVCGEPLELGRVSGEYEYIRLNPEGECFPTIRLGQNGDAGNWQFFCSNEAEHLLITIPGVRGFSLVEVQELLDWLVEHAEQMK